jgi:hypothetical protein
MERGRKSVSETKRLGVKERENVGACHTLGDTRVCGERREGGAARGEKRAKSVGVGGRAS